MKFAAHLTAHITPEWRKQYINYEELKQQLYEVVEQAPCAGKVDSSTLAHYFLDADEAFFNACEKELSKVNTFYSEKIAEAMRKFASLQHDLAAAYYMDVIEKPSYYTKNIYKKPPQKPSIKKLRRLEVAFSEFYLSLVLLQNYQTLNYSGFRKILKKHDKLFSSRNGQQWKCDNVDSAPFYANKDTDRLIEETENVVTIYLEEGNRQRAIERLHIPPIGEHQSLWTTFNLGLLMGTFLALFGIVVFAAVFSLKQEEYQLATRLYRSTFLITLFLFLCGLNVYGWRTSGVNHILIFEINPRSHVTEQHIMQMSMVFAIFWAGSVLGFIFSHHLGIPAYMNPLLLIFLIFSFLLNPSKTLFHEARRWFLRIIGRIIFAPFCKVSFADFWLAEQLTSLAPVLLDLHYIVCFYFTDLDWTNNGSFRNNVMNCISEVSLLHPAIVCLPAWFRFAQCLRRYHDSKQIYPHIVSAFKYAITFLIVFLAYNNLKYSNQSASPRISATAVTTNEFIETGTFSYLWAISVVFGTTFMFLWDVKVDWGLLNGGFMENKFLREQMIYSNETYYFIAIAANFVLRFCWAFSISLPDISYPNGSVFIFMATLLEILRRFIWNFFRLENEHLNNCGEFRAIRDISIVPLEAVDRDQNVLLRMMDEPDGVTNRSRKPISKVSVVYSKETEKKMA